MKSKIVDLVKVKYRMVAARDWGELWGGREEVKVDQRILSHS
jgi:hypothetical protein